MELEKRYSKAALTGRGALSVAEVPTGISLLNQRAIANEPDLPKEMGGMLT